MDYIIVSFLVAERTALSYAVGEWAKIWPLQTLIRAMGAFFVRRDSKNKLYRLVLERYVAMATREGVCQAVFPEGGLSRDGRLRPPKMGIIDYMLRDFDPDRDRDIIFIPVGINYDRTIEDRSLLRSLDPQAERRSGWYMLKTSLRFIVRGCWLMVQSRWQRFGYACVNFGPSLSAKAYCRQNKLHFDRLVKKARFEQVEALCQQLMEHVHTIIPVLPVPLVAAVFVDQPRTDFSAFDVEKQVNKLIVESEAMGAKIFVSTRSRVQNIVTALNMLKIRHLVIENDGLYRANYEHLHVLAYYANSIWGRS
jgi:glycerol-3-phosphate O-acyltransferase